ncbi:MAG: hypothetical protein EA376_01140 [Phycisphaeraceae bacterium]|nr:MAG: hypothetical protein EA376_01140 [Phycisphaeraceae bacterium]
MSQPNLPNPSTDAAVIELQATGVEQLFARFDPAPVDQRAIAPEAEAYILARVAQVPNGKPLRIRILLPGSEEASCEAVQSAFRSHFAAAAARRKAEFRQHFTCGLRLLLRGVFIALALIAIAQTIAAVSESLLMEKIAAGLSLIVWVTLWKPVDMLVYEWRPLGDSVKIFERLADVSVESRAAD